MMHQNTVVWKEFFFSPSCPVKSAQKHMQNINNGCLENSKTFTKACEFRRLCCELQQLEFTDYVRRNMAKVCVGSWCVKKKKKTWENVLIELHKVWGTPPNNASEWVLRLEAAFNEAGNLIFLFITFANIFPCCSGGDLSQQLCIKAQYLCCCFRSS